MDDKKSYAPPAPGVKSTPAPKMPDSPDPIATKNFGLDVEADPRADPRGHVVGVRILGEGGVGQKPLASSRGGTERPTASHSLLNRISLFRR